MPDEELQVLRTWHPNVLIGGAPGTTDAALQALRSVFRPTIVSWTVGAALQLPPDHGARTLILHDVDALSPEQQQQVLGWLQQDRGPSKWSRPRPGRCCRWSNRVALMRLSTTR